eukprot:jgi/Psemu1/8028/gm1.8028_g
MDGSITVVTDNDNYNANANAAGGANADAASSTLLGAQSGKWGATAALGLMIPKSAAMKARCTTGSGTGTGSGYTATNRAGPPHHTMLCHTIMSRCSCGLGASGVANRTAGAH